MSNFLHLDNPDNLMLVNVIYHRPCRESNWNDSIDIVYRDLDENKKKVKHIENPTMDVYFVKDENDNMKYNHNKTFIERDKCYCESIMYKDIEKAIAEKAGGSYLDYYWKCVNEKRRGALKNLHKYRYVFGSDLDIENYYRVQWYLNYNNDRPKKVTRAFLDIETDIINIKGFPEPGSCPVSVVTVVDADDKVCYTLALKNLEQPNAQIEDFMKNAKKFVDECHENFDESYGRFEYKIFMYDDEKELLIQLFALLNLLQKDFVMIWNMRFDIPFLIARLIALGLDPQTVICGPEFKVKECYYRQDKIDKKNKIDVANRGDFFHVSHMSVFIDDMVLYAGLRKGRSELTSFRLTAIAQDEIGDAKLDYSEDSDLKNLPYTNYWKYIMYNIKDVLLQLGIDNKAQDCENLYVRAYSNGTKYDKVFKQITLLKNRGYIEYWNQGLIKGNNFNIDYGSPIEEDIVLTTDDDEDDDGVKFSGALVCDPRLNDFTGKKLFGKKSMYIFDNVIDMDFSSMYPNTIIAFNIAPNTMIGKLIIEGINEMPRFNYKEPPSDKDKKKKKDKAVRYDAGQDFMDNLLTGNYALLGSTWFNLPTYEYIRKEFIRRFGLRETKHLNITHELYFLEREDIDIDAD